MRRMPYRSSFRNRTEMWEIEIRHEGLNKYRKIRGSDQVVVEEKAAMLQHEWDEAWGKKLAREKTVKTIEESKNIALSLTKEAEENILVIENTLMGCLEGKPFVVNWNWYKKHENYSMKKPTHNPPVLNSQSSFHREPMNTDKEFLPPVGFFDFLFKSKKQKEQDADEASARFARAHKKWEATQTAIEEKNQQIFEQNQIAIAKAQAKYEQQVAKWEEDKREFIATQKKYNEEIDKRELAYIAGNEDGIKNLVDIVLSSSIYPNSFPQEYTIDYNMNTQNLVVEYVLPVPENLPNLKDVKYIQSKNEFKETYLSEATMAKIYDNLLYQITLRTIREIYDADINRHIQAIVFNGWINSTDKATGKDYSACILSLQAGRDEFMDINLRQVDVKACFKKLKGVGSSQLFRLTPVAPILKMNRNDSRFVSSYDVADNIDESVNLAAMDWQDFEHLIRELFEKEFNQSGGEVKITRASKDGGVDAVAFDPDPIRGGKIVIQAKRYTNTVGLSAVRDLYGTVLNEGANKGILVSTADYGPDAYSFAKDKPITLLDGGNLLHLLQKHGHKARIDLREAKLIMAEQK